VHPSGQQIPSIAFTNAKMTIIRTTANLRTSRLSIKSLLYAYALESFHREAPTPKKGAGLTPRSSSSILEVR
jgi:hypothetical protein